ncbi:guanine nucleotide-binding protein subunit beta-2-like 1 [Uranotaenia lowii]|uniref:guanine nucleotide-binding protein subunit beta-2-like 1 n=1 Tax=Uranotaenia lowii TaxID=190385 RepID=UPI002479AD81|nr:guanine nucleotide-binding protein subunit beta-2-like 1 [Uranotaenia lowii]
MCIAIVVFLDAKLSIRFNIPEFLEKLSTGVSEDKSRKLIRDCFQYGIPQNSFYGPESISNVLLSPEDIYAFLARGTRLRLWDLAFGMFTFRSEYCIKEDLSVAFSVDRDQMVPGSQEITVKL